MSALPLFTDEPTSWWMRQRLSVVVVSRLGSWGEGGGGCWWSAIAIQQFANEHAPFSAVSLFFLFAVWRAEEKRKNKKWEARWWSPARRAQRRRRGEVCGLTCQWVGEVSSNVASCRENRGNKKAFGRFFGEVFEHLALELSAVNSHFGWRSAREWQLSVSRLLSSSVVRHEIHVS